MFKRPLVIGISIVACVAVWIAWIGKDRSTPVEVERVGHSSLESIFIAEGFVRSKSHTLSPSVAGRVTDLLVQEGDTVQKGQILLRVEDVEARDAVVMARSSLATARRLQLETESAYWAASKIAAAKVSQAEDFVRVAEARLQAVRGGARREELAKARHEAASLAAITNELDRRLQRAIKLRDAGVVPVASVEALQSELTSAVARQQAAEDVVRLLEAGPRAEEVEVAKRELASAHAEVAVAIASRQEVEVRRRQADSACARTREALEAVAAAERRSAKATLLAPVDGTVSKVSVELGAWVGPGFPAIVVTTRRDLHVEAEVRAEDLSEVAPGASVDVLLPTSPDLAMTGMVEWISRTGEPKPNSTIRTQIVRCRIRVDADSRLVPGTEVDVRFRSRRPRVLCLPSTAIRLDGPSPSVWVVEGGKVRQASIEIGAGDGEQTEIRRGLKEGDVVVVTDAKLKDGQEVTANERP